MDDNPPPENDAKLAERLTDYFGNFANEDDMIQKIDLNHIQFSDAEPSLKMFCDAFGMFDKPTDAGMSACFNIKVEPNQKKDETFEQINKSIDNVLKFKQIAVDREY